MLHSGCTAENPKYERRDPSQTPCYQIIQEELETFLADREYEGKPVPEFVEKEFRSYLECGILAHGFVRLHCDSCSKERIVAFSCKKKAWVLPILLGQTNGRISRTPRGECPAYCTLQAVCGLISSPAPVLDAHKPAALWKDPQDRDKRDHPNLRKRSHSQRM